MVVLIYLFHLGLIYLWDNRWFNVGSATLLLLAFTLFVLKIERRELKKIPILGRFIYPKIN